MIYCDQGWVRLFSSDYSELHFCLNLIETFASVGGFPRVLWFSQPMVIHGLA